MGRRRSLSGHEARLVACWERIAAGRTGKAVAAGSERADVRRLGRYRLRESQVAAVERIRAAFAECGGALLADPPGAGKTVVALATARDAPDVVVVAPAALRAQWERSVAHAGVVARFTSFEALSRDARPAVARGGLVIVDEAHHARTAGTRRYARLAELCAGARVLLLSATPVVNRAADREALLGLFLGARASGVAGSRCVIRRLDVRDSLPEVRRLPALPLPDTRVGATIAVMIGALPPPLPTADGATALALIRITLAMSWSSSLAALDAALRRRLQRGEALADSLAAGQWPTRAALKRWIIGDDSTQLAFPGLDTVGTEPPADATALLASHLAAIRALRAVVTPAVVADTAARSQALEALQRARGGERIVVFARHAETIRALWSASRSQGAVVAMLGERVLAAQGRWRRDEVLAALGPRATPLRADDPRAIRILLTTDLLSEGVELQGISTVVHADSAWTPATMEQREGRVARPVASGRPQAATTSRVVFVTTFPPPSAATPLLRLGRRLAMKDRARQHAVRDAECRAASDLAFASWPDTGRRAHAGPATAFLAAIRWRDRGAELVVAGTSERDRWRISEAPCLVARLASSTRVRTSGTGAETVLCIRRELARWLRRRAAHATLGEAPQTTTHRRGPWRQLRTVADRLLLRSTIAERGARATALEGAIATLEQHSGAGITRRLARLLREHAARPINAGALEAALLALAGLARTGAMQARLPPSEGDSRAVLVALVLLALPSDRQPLR